MNDLEGPPVISEIGDQITDDEIPAGPIAFTISAPETPAEELILVGKSLNPMQIPSKNIIFGGSGRDRGVTLTPVPALAQQLLSFP